MPTEADAEPVLAHVLFMDIVGCSKLASDEQKRIVGRLQELVRQGTEFQRARLSDQLISLPTGDGMALVFFDKLDAAVRCAVELTRAIQAESLCPIRMGVHTGPVFVMTDINNTRNISGAGINRAERVMSCGDEGHILLSDNVAESLRHLSAWQDKIHDVGRCQVKDGWMHVWNLVDGPVGNPARPKKGRRHVQRRQLSLAVGIAALAVILAAAITGPLWMRSSRKAPADTQDQASIAVMPFADLSPAKDQEYFSDGLTEELMNGLANTPGLRVAGKTSSFQFKNKTKDYRGIGQQLNVATILEGSVRKQGNRCRVAVQLIKAADGFDLWSQTFDREMNDIFAVQEEISRSVAGALKLKLLETAARSGQSKNIGAYNAYLLGRYFLSQGNTDSLAKAAGYFDQAIKLDPDFARAWESSGRTYIQQAVSAFVPEQEEERYRKARDAIQHALRLDENLGGAYAALGLIQMNHDWDWAGADVSYRRALALEPGDAGIIEDAASLAAVLGNFDDALALYRRAAQIDPLFPSAYKNIGYVSYYLGREEEAKAALDKALELAPEIAFVHGLLGQVYLAQSRPEEALAEMQKEKHPAFRLYGFALAYHALGRRKESDASLAQLIEKFPTDVPYQIAKVFAFRGESDRAFEWLERTYAERDAGLTEIKGDPLLKTLEHDPRYAALLKKLRLPL